MKTEDSPREITLPVDPASGYKSVTPHCLRGLTIGLINNDGSETVGK